MRKYISSIIAAAIFATAAISVPSTAHAVIVPPPKFVPMAHEGPASAPWMIIGCAGGVVLAALAANYRDGRQLTAPEAWTCGLLFWGSKPKKKGKH